MNPSSTEEAVEPTDHRDKLGRRVREVWVAWAQRQPNPKPSWLVPYDELSEADKEADRCIGAALWGDGFAQGIDALPTFEKDHRYQFVYGNHRGERRLVEGSVALIAGPPSDNQGGDGVKVDGPDGRLTLVIDGTLPVELAASLRAHGVVVLAAERVESDTAAQQQEQPARGRDYRPKTSPDGG